MVQEKVQKEEVEMEAATGGVQNEAMKQREETNLHMDNTDVSHLLITLLVTDLGHLPAIVASQTSLLTAHCELGLQNLSV